MNTKKSDDYEIGLAFIFIILLILGFVYAGYVTMQLRTWFIVPLGVIELSLGWAMGINLFVSRFTMDNDVESQSIEKSLNIVLRMYMTLTIMLGLGYVFYSMAW